MYQRLACLLCLTLVFAAPGCGGEAGKKPTFSATGKLIVDDKPFGPGTLALSAEGKEQSVPSLSGKVAQDGTVKFTAYGQEGSVVAGTYSATLTGDIMNASVKVPATSPVTVEIKPGDKVVEIKMKSIPGAAAVGGLPILAPPPK